MVKFDISIEFAMCKQVYAGIDRKEVKMMNFGYHSLWGLLILAGDIWAIINILQSSASNEKKLIWVIAVVLLPLLGLILWYFLGPRGGNR
jgi:hypothetical protein